MLKWIDIIKIVNVKNPDPERRVERSNAQWKEILTDEQFRITRLKGTERAHSSEMCSYFEPGKYACICCQTILFDSAEKYESGTGWPSFTQPVKENVVSYKKDVGFGMVHIEAICNICNAHLGHVFPDGPQPSGLRYCINAVALSKVESNESKLTFGGGCFWCTEAIFKQVNGVLNVESGYSGGRISNPTYREVCSGLTDHAEVIEVTYNNEEIAFADLLRIHLSTHNPTTVNKQGADTGTQYRSIIFYRNNNEKESAQAILTETQKLYPDTIVTQLEPFVQFYKADEYHQNYFENNPEEAYCTTVINPKLKKLRELFKNNLKEISK